MTLFLLVLFFAAAANNSSPLLAAFLLLKVGSVGEEQAAQYILREAQKVAAQAAASRPDLLVEAVRESVSRVLPGCRDHGWLALPCWCNPQHQIMIGSTLERAGDAPQPSWLCTRPPITPCLG
jgi:hypothetical protein